MSHLRNHRNFGTIPRASGAAAAALKARAAAWDMPVVETPEAMSLFVWGCELRLVPERDAVRIELSAPEARLIGTLQDSATELFAEAGLEVAWDRVDAGALAPGLSLMRVVSVTERSPGFLRVRLAGPDAVRFGMGGLHFRLLLAPAGRVPVWPRTGASGRTEWPAGADALHRPVYTLADGGDGWLDFDIFRHDGSPTCDWALSGPEGATVGIIGPGGGGCPDADRLHLFGDETALPAMARMLDLARGVVTAHVRASYSDLGPLAADPRVARCDDLLAALAQADLEPGSFSWFAGEAAQARQARQHLLARGLDRKDFMAAAYWG
ncbi:siderophore-interacting protein [Paracoccus sediminis]|uniref:NADPH-dependent ferric siderophore reductase, contains FAD-binding and SIP domains n=1 Tax=Paracoccus sediminis TaxID=1214787 RepID=A0A238VF29_9RHOB|nr:siderophore-interacting protein [Paracoccus sediminis]TBN52018.1 siderophore-interacting protein [Paracoccus sediminis]SNR32990.1 NADPH-dependent ferric siderophore reductase, contains FAD-binding and SIP domains [Paracoccus sediminis]